MGWVEGKLDPHRPGVGRVLDALAHQAGQVVGGAEHVAGGHVGVDEGAEAAEPADLRHGNAVASRQLLRRGRAHPALEVQVEVRLGQAQQIAHPASLSPQMTRRF